MKRSTGSWTALSIWGDVSYVNGMLFSPDYWRQYFKPAVKNMIDFAHSKDLAVIYHGCGNSTAIWPDLIEIGLDCLQPPGSEIRYGCE